MEQYFSEHEMKVPLERIAENKYLFGTKKVQTQIINGKLMVRVGGGYMTLAEFMDKHTLQEFELMKKRMVK